MSEFVLAFGVFQLWMYGFVSTIFSHSFWWGYALSLIVIDALLFTADHANDDAVTLLVLFVWWTFTYPIGSFVALMTITTLDFPRLIDINILGPNEKFEIWNAITFFFTWSWLMLYAGVNFVLLRFSKTGMSPIGGISDEDSISIGIVLLVLSGIIFVLVFVITYGSRDPIAMSNLKYLVLMAFLVWTGFIHDFLFGDIPYPWPGVIMLAALIGLIFLAIPLFYYWGGNWWPLDRDPYYLEIGKTLTFLTVFGIILIPAQIIGWTTNDITNGNHIAVFLLLLGYSILVCFSLLAVKYIFAASSEEAKKNGTIAGRKSTRKKSKKSELLKK